MNEPALPGPWGATLYDCAIAHVRTRPLRHAFRHRTFLWLVDLDAVPRLPRPLRPLARIEARDHPGDPRLTLRANLEHFLATRGVHLRGGRVLMLTQARSLGHVFNPITVYWCRGPDGRPLCTVAEVHNTYGEHHRYLLHPDERARSRTPKTFYVSPFLPVRGEYLMRLPEPDDRLDLAIHLELDGARPFTATVHGSARPAGPAALLRSVLRHPFSTLAVSLHIRVQGVRLLLRGLPVQPRTVRPRTGTPPSASPRSHEKVPLP